MKIQQKIPSFIKKLFSILRSKQNAKSINWDNELKGIRILNQQRLQQLILPRYFRHNRFQSFVRQLNMYGFRKLLNTKYNVIIFCHMVFNPNDEQTIYQVKRKSINNEVKINKYKKQIIEQDQVKVNVSLKKSNKDSFKSLKNVIYSQKQNNIWSEKSSFRLFNSSLKFLNQKISQNSMMNTNQQNYETQKDNRKQIMQEIVGKIIQMNLNSCGMQKMIDNLRKQKVYSCYLRKKSFKTLLYQRLGLEFDGQSEKLSELSIQGQLMFSTRRNLTNKSLKIFESGQLNHINYQTLSNLMSL